MQRVEFVPHYRCYNERCIGNRAGLHAKIAEPPPILCKDTNKPRAKANLFAFCRGEVSKKKSKIVRNEYLARIYFYLRLIAIKTTSNIPALHTV
jgi:hypothetical protein